MKEEALKLSRRNYLTVVALDETTDGKQCYVAFHPELPGCMSQGETPGEAKTNLEEATRLVIEHLLAHNLPVPDPQGMGGRLRTPRWFGKAVDEELDAETPLVELLSVPFAAAPC